jgi:uncharacterized membrane protein
MPVRKVAILKTDMIMAFGFWKMATAVKTVR